MLVAIATAALDARAPSTHEVVQDLVLSEDRSLLTFHAYGEDMKVPLSVAAEFAAEDGHFQGAIEGKEDSVAHVNVHDNGQVDVTFAVDGMLHFVDFDAKNDRYVAFKAADLPVDGPFLPTADDIADLPANLELEAQDAQRAAPAERPSTYRVVAYWESNPHPNAPSNPQTLLRGYFSTINSLVMARAGLPNFSVTLRRALKGYGRFPATGASRATTHDWFSNYVHNHQSEVSGANLVMWVIQINIGGRAYLGTACNSRYPMRYKTGVSGTTVTSNWYDRAYTMRTLAHEAGHLLGASHNFGSNSIMDYTWPRGTEAQKLGFFNSLDVSRMRSAGCA